MPCQYDTGRPKSAGFEPQPWDSADRFFWPYEKRSYSPKCKLIFSFISICQTENRLTTRVQ
jgi:hypothetical protein